MNSGSDRRRRAKSSVSGSLLRCLIGATLLWVAAPVSSSAQEEPRLGLLEIRVVRLGSADQALSEEVTPLVRTALEGVGITVAELADASLAGALNERDGRSGMESVSE